ncbi:MAG: hypothetical protein SGPRY_007118, partial [Prymnesium sp.]
FFGESALEASESDNMRLANVVCVTNVRAAKLMANDIKRLLGSDQVTAALQNKACVEEEVIIKQGEMGSTFYVIKAGEVEAGAYFGEASLLTDSPCNSTVRALSRVQLLTLSKKDFERLLGYKPHRTFKSWEVQGPLRDILEREKEARSKLTEAFCSPVLYSDLKMVAMLGEGSFGTVQLAQHTQTGECFALKTLNKGQLVHDSQVEHVIAERQLLGRCNSPFVLKLIALHFLTDFAQGGELFAYQLKERTFPENVAAIFVAQVALAFEHLHQRRIAHRDLKPENLLFDKNGTLKLVDFGFAKVIDDRSFSLCGTPEYLAPEIVSNKGHNKAVDWWTLGVLTYELISGHSPFYVRASKSAMFRRILVAQYKPLEEHKAQAFVAKLLVISPSARLGCLKGGTAEVLAQPFFNSIDWPALRALKVRMPFVPKLKSATDTSYFEKCRGHGDDVAKWDSYITDEVQERFNAIFGKSTAPE